MEADVPPTGSSLDQSVAPSWQEFPWPKSNNHRKVTTGIVTVVGPGQIHKSTLGVELTL